MFKRQDMGSFLFSYLVDFATLVFTESWCNKIQVILFCPKISWLEKSLVPFFWGAHIFDMMKVSGFWILFFVVGIALVLLSFSSSRTAPSIPDMVFSHHGDRMRITATGRKLKENGYNQRTDTRSDEGDVSLDDYRPIDPVPSSKASVRPGPIAHSTPLNPYIPKPSPPGHPKNGGST